MIVPAAKTTFNKLQKCFGKEASNSLAKSGQSEDKDISRGLLATDLTHFQRAPKVLKSTICYKSKYELKATLEM